MSAHTALVHDILHASSAWPDVRLWKQQVGEAHYPGGAVVRYGVPGMADISGIYKGGRRVEIECKTGKAERSARQRKWQAMVERFGGIYILARSVEDVREVVGC